MNAKTANALILKIWEMQTALNSIRQELSAIENIIADESSDGE